MFNTTQRSRKKLQIAENVMEMDVTWKEGRIVEICRLIFVRDVAVLS